MYTEVIFLVTQLSRWDNVGTEAPAGDAEYVAGQQPIAEWDNYFNWSAAKDVENLIAALENVTTGHDHDGTDSKKVDGGNVINTPAGNIAATDVQAAINELDTEKLAKSLFDTNTIMKANSDDTPLALTVAEQTLVGRITAGVITALTAAQVRTLLNFEGEDIGIRVAVVKVLPDDLTLVTGTGLLRFTVPIEFNGMNLISVGLHVYTSSSGGLPTCTIYNETDSVTMLSTALSIDANENDSLTATTPAVIDAAHDDVATGDVLRFDCSIAGTGTEGCEIRMGFQTP